MPDDRTQAAPDREELISAADCARRMGLTVRALRVYEREGLIRPRRTAKGWRVYGAQELHRLGAVQALKAMGLPLKEIARVLARGTPPLDRLLEVQAKAWRLRLAEAERGLAMAEAALGVVRRSGSLTLDTLCDMVRRMTMTEMPAVLKDVIDEMYTPAEQAAWAARKAAVPEAEIRKGEADWAVLIAEIKAMVAAGTDPASPEAQAALDRWSDLTRAFWSSDKAKLAKGAQMWTTALSRDPQGQQLPFGKDIWEFMGAAKAARG